MKAINEVFTDLRGAIDLAAQPVRNYNKTSDNIYKPEHARFKLVVWFKDGNTRYYYSYDNKTFNNERLTDEFEALKKLIRLIDKYKGKYKNAFIYSTLDPNKPTISNYNCEVLKYDIYGNMRANEHVNFKNEGKNIIFDVQRMNYLQKFKI